MHVIVALALVLQCSRSDGGSSAPERWTFDQGAKTAAIRLPDGRDLTFWDVKMDKAGADVVVDLSGYRHWYHFDITGLRLADAVYNDQTGVLNYENYTCEQTV